MYTGLLHLHNILRWVVILLLLFALVRHLMGMTSRSELTPRDKKISLFLMIAAHLQLLIGLYQWFAGPWGYQLIKKAGGMGEVMKNGAYRFWVVEHMTGMLVAIILITIGRGVVKKDLTDPAKHKRMFWLFFIALILILAVVPWPGREGIGRPLYPGAAH